MRLWVWSLASLSGLRIWYCLSRIWCSPGCGVGPSCSPDLTSSSGTSICPRCGHKKKKNKPVINALLEVIALWVIKTIEIIAITLKSIKVWQCYYCFLATSKACGSSQGRNRTCNTAVIREPQQWCQILDLLSHGGSIFYILLLIQSKNRHLLGQCELMNLGIIKSIFHALDFIQASF